MEGRNSLCPWAWTIYFHSFHLAIKKILHVPTNRPAFTRRHRKTNRLSQVPKSQTNRAVFTTIGIPMVCPNDPNVAMSQPTYRRLQHLTQIQLEGPDGPDVPTNRPISTRQQRKMNPMSQEANRYSRDNGQKQTECPNCRNVSTNQALILNPSTTKSQSSQMFRCPMSQSQSSTPFTPYQKAPKSQSSQMSRCPMSQWAITKTILHSNTKPHSYQNHHKCPDRPDITYPPIPLNGKAFHRFSPRGILINNTNP